MKTSTSRGWYKSDDRSRDDEGRICSLTICASIRAFLGFWAILFALLCGFSGVEAQKISGYSHRHWDVEEGSPSDIRAITQTRDGFLWLGTSNGLYRFDGLTFEHIEPAGYSRWRSNQITALAAAPDGALWVGYDFGGIGVYHDGQLRDANAEPRPSGSVWSLMVARSGDVWATINGSRGGEVQRLHAGLWRTYTAKDWFQPEPVQDIYEARDGTIWIAQLHSILRLPPGAARPETIAEQTGFATAFTEDENGALWLASGKGLQRLTAPRSLRDLDFKGPSAGGGGKRSLLFEDGLAWIAGQQDGIVRLSNLKALPGGRDLVAVHSRVLYRDREGTIWGGGPDGLVNYIRSPVLRVDLEGTPTTGFAVGSGPHPPIYVATDAGVYRLSGPSPEPILKAPSITALCAGQSDHLLAVGLQRQHLLRGGVWTSNDGPKDSAAASDCAIDAAGGAWETRPGTGLFQWVRGRWEPQPGSPGGQIIESDGKGGVFVSQPMRALLHVRPGSVQTLLRDDQIAVGFVRLIKTAGATLYLGGEKGLARFDGKRVVTLETRAHPWLSGISGLAIGQEDVWLIDSEGIFRVARGDFDRAFEAPAQPLRHQLIGDRLGLTSRSLSYVSNDAILDEAGQPWFVTNRGVVRVDPGRIGRNLVPPPVTIRSLEANGKLFRQPDLTLPAGTTRFQFDYVGLSLTNSLGNIYRYKLAGVDEGWVDAGSRRQATYTGLRPGRYVFQVVAANSDGVWNQTGAVMKVRILPYFWQTWWFNAAVLLAFGMLLWGLVQWRLRVVAEVTRQRLEDRLAVREHIAQELHDTLLQGFQGLVLRFQSVLARLPIGHPARSEMEATLDRADDVLQEGRDRVRHLRQETEPVELRAMLAQVAQNVLGDQVHWTITETGAPRAVQAPVADDISRIANEAMFNALRHAHATEISLRILNGPDRVTVCICDDGVGLDPAIRRRGRKEGHYGLVGMRERAQRLGATLKIGNATPSGTEICLTIRTRVACN